MTDLELIAAALGAPAAPAPRPTGVRPVCQNTVKQALTAAQAAAPRVVITRDRLGRVEAFIPHTAAALWRQNIGIANETICPARLTGWTLLTDHPKADLGRTYRTASAETAATLDSLLSYGRVSPLRRDAYDLDPNRLAW